MIFAYYDLGVIIGYGEQVPEFTVDGCLSVQAEGDLDVNTFVALFANKINFLRSQRTHFDIIAQVEQLIVDYIFQKLTPVGYLIPDNYIPYAGILKIEFTSDLEYFAADQIIARYFVNDKSISQMRTILLDLVWRDVCVLGFQKIADPFWLENRLPILSARNSINFSRNWLFRRLYRLTTSLYTIVLKIPFKYSRAVSLRSRWIK